MSDAITIIEGWEEFRADVLAEAEVDKLPELEQKLLQMTFFAGAAHCLSALYPQGLEEDIESGAALFEIVRKAVQLNEEVLATGQGLADECDKLLHPN